MKIGVVTNYVLLTIPAKILTRWANVSAHLFFDIKEKKD
jgi:hypothetical protein